MNFADAYYCRSCENAFNPQSWPCPNCESDERAFPNPIDDHCEYYCFECDMAFNRLGPSFSPHEVEWNTLHEGFEVDEKQLELIIEKETEISRRILQCRLHNTGQQPVRVQGHRPLAIQYRVTDDEWWTIYGNPDGFSPFEGDVLHPHEHISWEIVLSWEGIAGPGFRIAQRLPSGEYRVVYWGVGTAETVLAAPVSIEFQYSG